MPENIEKNLEINLVLFPLCRNEEIVLINVTCKLLVFSFCNKSSLHKLVVLIILNIYNVLFPCFD